MAQLEKPKSPDVRRPGERKEHLPHLDAKRELLRMLEDLGDEDARAEAETLRSMSPEEIRNALRLAALNATSDRHRNQQHIGGDFIDPEGRLRARKLMSLDLEGLTKEYPFLKRLAFKEVPVGTRLAHEIDMHAKIQDAADADPASSVIVPRLIDSLDLPDEKLLGFFIERLPQSRSDASLQSFTAGALKEKAALRLSENVTAKIERMYEDLHRLGFAQGDINEGNLYLLGAEIKEYVLPKKAGKIRPRAVRVVHAAEVRLIDFERAQELKHLPDDAAEAESDELRELLDAKTLYIDEDASIDEVAEASDDLFESRDRQGPKA